MKEMRKMQVWSLCRDDSLEEEMTIHSSILVWIFPWTRNLVGYSPWDCRIKQIEHRIMCSMQARTHTHMQTHTNACTHRDLPSPGPREEAAGWEHLDFVHIWKRHICLSWNMSLRSKCLIWQASGRVPNCSVMETGGRHLFFFLFFFSWWVPSSSSLSASLQLTVSHRQKLILQSESGFLPLPPHRGHL